MIIKELGMADYSGVYHDMQRFTLERQKETQDELWLVEHFPVFTQGINGKPEHIRNLGKIPLVQSDRGGQVTYHGPGQLVAYTLFDLKRSRIGVREMVSRLENSVIAMLADFDVSATARTDAPGVYVDDRKIASLGLRVKKGACYHGISINIDMDLTPFSLINPCGYQGMEVIDFKGLGCDITVSQARRLFVAAFDQQMQAERSKVVK